MKGAMAAADERAMNDMRALDTVIPKDVRALVAAYLRSAYTDGYWAAVTEAREGSERESSGASA